MVGTLYFRLRIVDYKKNIRKYEKSNCVSFRSTKDEFGGLSNMAGGFPIKINDIWIRNSEVLYQSLKYPYNPEIQKHILQIPSPIIAKKVSRKYIGKIRKDWSSIQYKVMKFCIEIKLIQNQTTFSKLLVATRNFPIVEISKRDDVWGAIDKGEYYEGINALGRLLMAVREKYINNPNGYKIETDNLNDMLLLGIDLKEYFS